MPAPWRVLCEDGDAWRPVETSGPYGVDQGQYYKVTFAPVTTGGPRLEVVLRPDVSAGIQEWKVR